MLINLVLLKPRIFEHGRTFDEVILFYAASLRNLGHEVELSVNRFSSSGLNLLFAWQLLPMLDVPDFSGLDYVVVQLEGLLPIRSQPTDQQRVIEQVWPVLHQARAIWDYAPENLAVLQAHGLNGRLMPLGYNEALLRYTPWAEPDLDVLFMGLVTPRRARVLDRLRPLCRMICLSNCFGPERDALIARSKLVLNLHAYDHLHQLEQVRVFDLFAHRMLVVSECCNWQPYGTALISYDYDRLVEGVRDWLDRPESVRRQAAEASHQALRRIPFRAMLEQMLREL